MLFTADDKMSINGIKYFWRMIQFGSQSTLKLGFYGQSDINPEVTNVNHDITIWNVHTLFWPGTCSVTKKH